MLEIRKGSATKSFENIFFREFADNLSRLFQENNWNGLLLGNSVIENRQDLQIDALLICENQILIIDFKNYGGNITIPGNSTNEFEFIQWTSSEGGIISSGHSSNRNPYQQVSKQRDKFIKILEEFIEPEFLDDDKIDFYQIRTAICFQKSISLVRNVPGHLEKYFFIMDKENYLSTLKDIIDTNETDIVLSDDSFDLFKKVFKADEYKIKEDYFNYYEIKEFETNLNFENLYQDQKIALQEIDKFLKNDEREVFIIQGTTHSGKSYLLPFIKELVNKSNRDHRFLASSGRVGNNLFKETNYEFSSVYQYIYGGNVIRQKEINEEEGKKSSIVLEIVPVKDNQDSENTVYIFDEAQLLTNKYNESIDVRFGSGHLLADFIQFSDFTNKKNKVILLGDCFQVSQDKDIDSVLNPDLYKTNFNLNADVFQLQDKSNIKKLVDTELGLVEKIRTGKFNELSINDSEFIHKVDEEDTFGFFKEKYSYNDLTPILCFSKVDAQRINDWIKLKVLGTGNDLYPNDLLLVQNNIKTQKDPFSEPKKIFNGEFARVSKVGITEVIEGIQAKLNFRDVQIELIDKGLIVDVKSFENIRLNPKAELSKEELISYKVFIEQLARESIEKFKDENNLDYIPNYELKGLFEEELKEKPLKGIKGKILQQVKKVLDNMPDSDYFKYKNAIHLKYGWALTVHKSRSYKWDEIIFSVETGTGKTNENYFKWYYTGLTRAKRKVNLLKYKSINCLSKVDISNLENTIKPSKEFFLITNNTLELNESSNEILNKFNFKDNPNNSSLVQLFQLINSKFDGSNYTLNSITHNNYQEVYDFRNLNAKSVKVSFYYNNKGQISLPKIVKSDNEIIEKEVVQILTDNSNIKQFDFIKDDWRKEFYIKLNEQLTKENIYISYIIQTPYKDTIQLYEGEDKSIVEFNYDGQCFYSVIKSTYFSNVEIWNKIKEIINQLKELSNE
ncbi:NERD domain-containing protein [Empedobacter falsenii]|uniref:NERD domain-containing protein n=1 Tax=Empedobacter falsenii TaxID=343874 RepID=UPI0025786234|nr:NERD domain-containing protein [Empedobacter falsenii]MDM1063955.1 NERD domain-containing protein [Empedobacter falsenii]